MTRIIAGIDVHKRVLMAVVVSSGESETAVIEKRRFGSTTSELLHLLAWLQHLGVSEAVMESTAQYWKPVWLALEGHMRLFLAQAWSNRAPRARKGDFKDAERLARRHIAGELALSFVPEAEQRMLRSLTRRRAQLTRDRVRIQNQVESLLEETRIKLSSVVSDLFGATGRRMLEALAKGESDPVKLAALADPRVQRPREELADALSGSVSPIHCQLLHQHLTLLAEIDKQLEEVSQWTAELLHHHSDVVRRLTAVPGIRVLAAEQILAEVGVDAQAFPSAAQFSSWIGVCPGKEESAGVNHSGRCAKGNPYLRRVLSQIAQAAVRTKNSFFEHKFKRLLPRLGYAKAIWAIAHHVSKVIWKILHEHQTYVERGSLSTPGAAKRRVQRLRQELRKLGYSDQLVPLQPEAVPV